MSETNTAPNPPAEDARKLKAPFIPPQGWGADDRVLSVVGLETYRRPSSEYLYSVLGCFWFSADASYLGMMAVSYDFGNFGTSDLAKTVADYCFREQSEREEQGRE